MATQTKPRKRYRTTHATKVKVTLDIPFLELKRIYLAWNNDNPKAEFPKEETRKVRVEDIETMMTAWVNAHIIDY